jgi:hypothetical protein
MAASSPPALRLRQRPSLLGNLFVLDLNALSQTFMARNISSCPRAT